MDASDPQLPRGCFDAVVCRHLLWAHPEPAKVLERWTDLLAPGGRLLLIEGYWATGAGLRAGEVIAALPPDLSLKSVENLGEKPDLWGAEVNDERYAVLADVLHASDG